MYLTVAVYNDSIIIESNYVVDMYKIIGLPF